MTLIDISDTVIVFDLDDTLYAEIDYHQSGINEIIVSLGLIYGRSCEDELRKYTFKAGESNFLGEMVSVLNLPIAVKESLLWIYRLHSPKIALSESVANTLKNLEISCKKVVILTDGRSISQRRKIESLGLSHLPIYISEEYESEKPEQLRFIKIMKDFPSLAYVYVGDNPNKDFLAPNALNWKTVGLTGNINRNIHSQDCINLAVDYHPNVWIESIHEIVDVLF